MKYSKKKSKNWLELFVPSIHNSGSWKEQDDLKHGLQIFFACQAKQATEQIAKKWKILEQGLWWISKTKGCPVKMEVLVQLFFSIQLLKTTTLVAEKWKATTTPVAEKWNF